jgi:ribosome-binding factor A
MTFFCRLFIKQTHDQQRTLQDFAMRERAFSKRQRQVAEEVRRALSSILSHFRDAERGQEFSVTVTEVQMSPDLRHGKVFFTSLGRNKDICTHIAGLLNQQAPLIQNKLKSSISLRFLPKLRFYEDTAFDVADTIHHELRKTRPPHDT